MEKIKIKERNENNRKIILNFIPATLTDLINKTGLTRSSIKRHLNYLIEIKKISNNKKIIQSKRGHESIYYTFYDETEEKIIENIPKPHYITQHLFANRKINE